MEKATSSSVDKESKDNQQINTDDDKIRNDNPADDDVIENCDETLHNNPSPQASFQKGDEEERDTGSSAEQEGDKEEETRQDLSSDDALSQPGCSYSQRDTDSLTWPKYVRWEDAQHDGFLKPDFPSVAFILKDPGVSQKHRQALKALYVIYRKVVTSATRLRRAIGDVTLFPMLRPSQQRAGVVNYLVSHIQCMTRIHTNAEVFQPKFVLSESQEERKARRLRFLKDRRYRLVAAEVFVSSGCAWEMCSLVTQAMSKLPVICISYNADGVRTAKSNDALETGVTALKTVLGFTSECDVVRRVVLRHPSLTLPWLVCQARQFAKEHFDRALVAFETSFLQGCLELLYNLSEDEEVVRTLRSLPLLLPLCRRLLLSFDNNVRNMAMFLLASLLEETDSRTDLITLTDPCVRALVQTCTRKVHPCPPQILWEVDVIWKYSRAKKNRLLLQKCINILH